MTMQERIESLIKENFTCEDLVVINESHKHKGHAGDDGSGETHYNLMVVSSDFCGLSRVERQRAVNAVLNPLFLSGLHALSMRLNTPE